MESLERLMEDAAETPPANESGRRDWLRDSLQELGWTYAELSRKLGRRPETVSRWKNDVPDYVVAYVREALSTRWLLDQYMTIKMADPVH